MVLSVAEQPGTVSPTGAEVTERTSTGLDRPTGGSPSRLPDVQAPNERLICENN